MKKSTHPVILSLSSCDPLEFSIGEHFERKDMLVMQLVRYAQGSNPLLVCGAPKSGKTAFSKEVARAICGVLPNGDGEPEERRIHIIPYCGSVKESISNLYIPGYILLPWDNNWSASADALKHQQYCEKLQILRSYAVHPSIFILDDVTGVSLSEIEEEPEYQDLLSLGTVIVVSDDVVTYPEWVISPVPEHIYNINNFRPSKYSSDERKAFQNAVLLPPDGMGSYSFIRSMDLNYWGEMWGLIENGLLPSDHTCRVFPIQGGPIGKDEDYMPFLKGIYYAPIRARKFYSRTWNRSCYILHRAAEILPDISGQFAYWAADLHWRRGDYTAAIQLYNLFLRKQQALSPPSKQMLPTALFEAGKCQVFLGNNTCDKESRERHFQRATDYFDSALPLALPRKSKNLDLVTDIMLLKAQLMRYSGDTLISDQLCADALSEQEDAHPTNTTCLAPWYIKAAYLYSDVAEVRKYYAEKALDLLTSSAKDKQALADVCILMESCAAPSDLQARIHWERQAIQNLDACTSWCKHRLYTCHIHLANLAQISNDLCLQAEALRAAIEILLEMLPPNHPQILQHTETLTELERVISQQL